MTSKLTILEFSDVHLGHRTTPTVHILNNLRRAFPNAPVMDEIDVIFIAGDLFDNLLSYPRDEVHEIEVWMSQFLLMCKERNIVLRVLEGTPSHDWKQSKAWAKLNERTTNIGVDFEYVDKIDVRRIESLGIDVLYIPDEMGESDVVWMTVQKLLREKGLEAVDYAVMHGCFSYQLPGHANHDSHDPERYQSIVRKRIFIGHHHRHSTYGKIIASGSFDRLAHGEEEDKGHVKVVDYGQHDEVTFVPNKRAMIYHSVDCCGLSTEEAVLKVRALQRFPDGSFMRIVANQDDPVLASLDVFRKEYPYYTWSPPKVQSKVSLSTEDLKDMRSRFKGVDITVDNVGTLTEERLKKLNADPSVIRRCLEILKTVA